jgi:S-adenosylmethionine/arginine decarboxylase-like enzyme
MKHTVRLAMVACGFAVVAIAAGCAMQQQQTLQSLNQPINCATAEGDIRVLQSEKTHVGQQIASGVAAISPAGIVMGALTGTETTKLRVATGDYNNQIDLRIAAIKSTCGVQ